MFIRFVAVFFPFFLTLNYFVLLADAPANVQKTAYTVGKIIQFALPVFYVGYICKERLWIPTFSKSGLRLGAAFGVAVAAMMLVTYFAFLSQSGNVLAPDSPVRQVVASKMQGLGIVSGRLWLLLGVFYSVIHSGLEEYYWRWFVYRKLPCPAIVASAGFTLHHIILVGTYFGYTSPYCGLCSLGVFFGGLFWCYLYRWSNSIWGAWLGHGIIDAAIFAIGYFICTSG
jgi:membrane protease YdiL (CAAX protease family)